MREWRGEGVRKGRGWETDKERMHGVKVGAVGAAQRYPRFQRVQPHHNVCNVNEGIFRHFPLQSRLQREYLW